MTWRGWVAAVSVVAVVAALIVWLVISQNDWNHRCEAAGGRVEERFDGFMTMLIGNPPVVHLQPQYSYHCWVGGREIDP